MRKRKSGIVAVGESMIREVQAASEGVAGGGIRRQWQALPPPPNLHKEPAKKLFPFCFSSLVLLLPCTTLFELVGTRSFKSSFVTLARHSSRYLVCVGSF